MQHSNYITTVYRIYGTKAIVVIVVVIVRIEHVITVRVRVSIAKPEICIVRVAIDITRGHPNNTHNKDAHIPTTMP